MHVVQTIGKLKVGVFLSLLVWLWYWWSHDAKPWSDETKSSMVGLFPEVRVCQEVGGELEGAPKSMEHALPVTPSRKTAAPISLWRLGFAMLCWGTAV